MVQTDLQLSETDLELQIRLPAQGYFILPSLTVLGMMAAMTLLSSAIWATLSGPSP